MTKYDGPSYFKNSHPKIKPIEPATVKRKKEPAKYELPKNIQTRNELKDESRRYLKTPSHNVPNDPPPERYPFKSKHIPSSLQKLDGWDKRNANVTLLSEIIERLQKDAHTYLLFEEHLSDEMRNKLEQKEQSLGDKVSEQHKLEKERSQKVDPAVDKAKKIKKETSRRLMKPGSGLHRSLSNIIAEEQIGIQKSQKKLDNLFTEKNKKNFKK